MRAPVALSVLVPLAALLGSCGGGAEPLPAPWPGGEVRGALIESVERLATVGLRGTRAFGGNLVVLPLDQAALPHAAAARRRVAAEGVALAWWVRARDEEELEGARASLAAAPAAAGVFVELAVGPLAPRVGEDGDRVGLARALEVLGDAAQGARMVPVVTADPGAAPDGELAGIGSAPAEVALLSLFRAFEREEPGEARWIVAAAGALCEAAGLEPGRVLLVLQGWAVHTQEIQAQIHRAREAEAGGYVIAWSEVGVP